MPESVDGGNGPVEVGRVEVRALLSATLKVFSV